MLIIIYITFVNYNMQNQGYEKHNKVSHVRNNKEFSNAYY